jgi:hypothetical protein
MIFKYSDKMIREKWARLDTAVYQALLIFIIFRLFLSFWGIVATGINPVPETPDEVLRPYLGSPQLTTGWSGLLLEPWQRFDGLRYLRLAREGYAHEEDSVFPPLYPLLIRGLGNLLGGGHVNHLLASLLLSNLATLGLLILLHRLTTTELGPAYATRTLVYLLLFPTGFFLFAPYTESLFMLLALASLGAGRHGLFWLAGTLGLLAALTRLTGWVLVIPLLYEWWRQRGMTYSVLPTQSFLGNVQYAIRNINPRQLVTLFPTLLPGVGLLLFLGWRWWVGLPPINQMYVQYWYQTTGIPGQDVVTAAHTLFLGGPARANEYLALALDFGVLLLLLATTAVALRRLPTSYALYAALLLLFMLLPTSEFKPLYSFSRYALAFFPTFWLLALWGENPWVNRLILYTSLLLYLYFSGQFFVWGWVA